MIKSGAITGRIADITKGLRRDLNGKGAQAEALGRGDLKDENDRDGIRRLEFERSMLQSVFTREEFDAFSNTVRETAFKFPEIQGVLVGGSLVRQISLPVHIPSPQGEGLKRAYQEIIFRYGRKYFPHPGSDLDIWLLIDDVEKADKIASHLDSRTLGLLEWYASQRRPDLYEWIGKKREVYDAYYKQSYLYPRSWNRRNEIPYHGMAFKESLVDNIGCSLRYVRDRTEGFFLKSYPDEFLEVRAYPSAVFNLRPEPLVLSNGSVDRTPFAYFLKDWIDLEENCMVLYRREDGAPVIYPFDQNGVIRGQKIAEFIKWDPKHPERD
jgi:hypothetical protein